MIFVPEDVLARFEQKQKLETSPIVTNMTKTDSEMFFNVCTDMDDAEKQKLYLLREFGTVSESIRQQNDDQIPTVQFRNEKR